MKLEITHTTEYEYSAPAIESVSELRVCPRNTARQRLLAHHTEVQPQMPLEVYEDCYGNRVQTLSVPVKHTRLCVTARSVVETEGASMYLEASDMSVSEAVHYFISREWELYDFLMESRLCRFSAEVDEIAARMFPSMGSFGEAVLGLNEWIYREFEYRPGVTTVSTPVEEVLRMRRGVCQDFAHVMISILRATGIPARYVSGYIESGHGSGDGGRGGRAILRGAEASHAWVEVFTPLGEWVGLDPTNNCKEGEQHVQVAVGRDYEDVPPLRGVFKGSEKQQLSVLVTVSRVRSEESVD
ncbi:MAG: transglutaminase family protein [Methylacidiphilales bacterium]|nr:transglutaminase family protein [Candidatus Methylacidiphilales bacterium]MDW8349869.1 transglutaminase family protein [Verrucomicrobiae bacterium]